MKRAALTTIALAWVFAILAVATQRQTTATPPPVPDTVTLDTGGTLEFDASVAQAERRHVLDIVAKAIAAGAELPCTWVIGDDEGGDCDDGYPNCMRIQVGEVGKCPDPATNYDTRVELCICCIDDTGSPCGFVVQQIFVGQSSNGCRVALYFPSCDPWFQPPPPEGKPLWWGGFPDDRELEVDG